MENKVVLIGEIKGITDYHATTPIFLMNSLNTSGWNCN